MCNEWKHLSHYNNLVKSLFQIEMSEKMLIQFFKLLNIWGRRSLLAALTIRHVNCDKILHKNLFQSIQK